MFWMRREDDGFAKEVRDGDTNKEWVITVVSSEEGIVGENGIKTIVDGGVEIISRFVEEDIVEKCDGKGKIVSSNKTWRLI